MAWFDPSIFFFQAEDGIRDDLVTGVQTCALPISALRERTGRGEATVACADNGNVHAVRQFLRRSRRRGGNSLKPVVLFLDRHDERLEVRGILALLRSGKNAAGDASIFKTWARVRPRTHQAVLAPSPLLRHRPREATAPAARTAADQFLG